eukprot:358664-Alexandrium_andersonii.AAC.1
MLVLSGWASANRSPPTSASGERAGGACWGGVGGGGSPAGEGGQETDRKRSKLSENACALPAVRLYN